VILDLVSELEEGEIYKPKMLFIHQAAFQIFRNYNQYELEFRGQQSAVGDKINGAFQVIYLYPCTQYLNLSSFP